MNLISIIFFSIGCLMMILSGHTQDIKLVMPGCQTTMVQTFPYPEKALSKIPSENSNNKNLFSDSKADINLVMNNIGFYREEDQTSKIQRNKFGMVEFVSYGNYVHYSETLKLNISYTPQEHIVFNTISSSNGTEGDDLGENGNQEIYSVPKIKLFIAITSACCDPLSIKSRQEIRKTWKKQANNLTNVDIKFFLGQPTPDKYDKAKEYLSSEVDNFDDIIFIRGLEKYENLPNKTFGILKYAISSPAQYTHVLKTDDDCYVRVTKILDCLYDGRGEPLMKGVYMGCMENRYGFMPIRDTNSKWFLSWDNFPDNVAREIWGTKYLAGWGYIMSRDVILYAMKKVSLWQENPEIAPIWFSKMCWEDVMMGILTADEFEPIQDYHFKAAWRACTNETAVRHLDIDAPMLFSGLYEQELSGLWDSKTVQCSSGKFIAGDYSGWKRWRNSVAPQGGRV